MRRVLCWVSSVLLMGLLIGGQMPQVMLIAPGPAVEVAPLVTVAGQPAQSNRGRLLLTTVRLYPVVTPLQWLHATLTGYGELITTTPSRSAGLSIEQYRQITHTQLLTSAATARVVALRRAGYPATLRTHGVLVTGVQPGRPAAGVLQPQDQIIAVDDQPVDSPAAAVAALRRRAAGQPVTLAIERAGAFTTITLPTTSLDSSPHLPTIGATLTSITQIDGDPLAVELAVDEIGGPSAGLMLALAVLNALSPTDLTHGHPIAGTGAIGLNEQITAVDGITHKVYGAERAGAQIFFVPTLNAAEARAAATTIRVVPVDTLQDALDVLATLDGEQPAAGR